MEWREFTAKTVNEALTNALIEFETTVIKLSTRLLRGNLQNF